MKIGFFLLLMVLLFNSACSKNTYKYSRLFGDEKKIIGKKLYIIPTAYILLNVEDIGLPLSDIKFLKKINRHEKVKIKNIFNLKTRLPYQNEKYWFYIETDDKIRGYIPDCSLAEKVYVAKTDNTFLYEDKNKFILSNDEIRKGDLIYVIDSSGKKFHKIKINADLRGYIRKTQINKETFLNDTILADDAIFLNMARISSGRKFFYDSYDYYFRIANNNNGTSFIKAIADSELRDILKNHSYKENINLSEKYYIPKYYRKFDDLYDLCNYKGHIYDNSFFKDHDDFFTIVNSTRSENESETKYYIYADRINYYGSLLYHAVIEDIVSLYSISEVNDDGYVLLGKDKFENYILEKTNFFFNYQFRFILKEISGNINPVSPIQCIDKKYAFIDNYETLKINKINSEGRQVWIKEFPYITGRKGLKLLTNDNGDFFIFSSFSWMNKNNINNDLSVIKTDENGTFIWEKIIPRMRNAMILKEDDSISLLYTYNYGKDRISNTSLLKIDYDGNVRFNKIYISNYKEENLSVDITDDAYIISSNIISDENEANKRAGKVNLGLYIRKIDRNGYKIWDKLYGLQTDNEIVSHVIQANDGSYILFGYSPIDMHLCSQFIYKLDRNGKPVRW